MEIIRQSEHVTDHHHALNFVYRGDTTAGFSFDCDKAGKVDVENMNPAGRENYEKCLDGTHDVIDKGVQSWENSYRVPAVGKCECGREVQLEEHGMSGIDCECGRIYNSSGQALAPRSQWGEETGESFADMNRPGDPFEDF